MFCLDLKNVQSIFYIIYLIYIYIYYQNYQIYHLNLRKVLFGFLFLPHQPRLPEPSFIIALLGLAMGQRMELAKVGAPNQSL